MNNNNNLSEFTNVYEDMLFTRLEYMDIKVSETKELCNIKNDVEDIYQTIKNLLPSEHKKLIEEYEDTRTSQQALTEKIVYERGLKDGAKLMNILSN